jgi:hypothetical protein
MPEILSRAELTANKNASKKRLHGTGLPDFWGNMKPKPEEIYQINRKCTKLTENIPKVCKILPMAIKCINIFQSKAL